MRECEDNQSNMASAVSAQNMWNLRSTSSTGSRGDPTLDRGWWKLVTSERIAVFGIWLALISKQRTAQQDIDTQS